MARMNPHSIPLTSRRDFLKNTGRLTAASALAGMALPHVHAAENNTIQVALIGCGGRGTGAASQALSTKSGPIKLVALADVFENRVKSSYDNLKQRTPPRSTSRKIADSLDSTVTRRRWTA
jgi:hypothetical protein